MIFKLTEDQLMIQKMAREFAEKAIAPGVAERDEKEYFDRELVDALGESGFNGICFPEKYGGADGDYLSYILALEEIFKVDAGIGITLSTTVSVCATPIYNFGTEEQKQKYLVPLLEGKHMGAFCLTEPNAGSDAAAQQSTAVLDGDEYVINGSKIFITNALEAETYIVFAVTDKSKGKRGISAFIVEKGTPGLIFGTKEHKMGLKSSITMEVSFQDMRVPKANLLGKEGEGLKIALSNLDGGRIGVAAMAVGIAQGAFEHALKYSQERVQFGKPICKNQAIAFMLADMGTKIEAARLLTYQAACLKDAGLPHGKEASMAKLFASETCMQVTVDAVQIFGGYGYSREYPVERLMRNAKITQIFEGTSQIQRIVISNAFLGK